MGITTRRAAILVAAGAIALGGVAVAAPALAGAGPFGGPTVTATSGPGPGWHGGMDGMGGMGGGGMGTGHGDGMGPGAGGCLSTVPAGTLSEAQKTTLAAMAQEEKLAHDLYTAFATRYDAVVFDRIARSETQHLAMVRALLDRYKLADPTAGKAAGQFSDSTVQATYDRLLARGSANLTAALQVGAEVERADIADLRAALDGLTAADVTHVYTMLLRASERHLAAFGDR
ncbi:hypothetical protein GCM10009557_04070 [Virgisporangium ochraceum]|uniref:DUF2202 domain-containing protein n=1 Tax=Virgisporangium ochraceum TaxID=65505 RepID=A0A8J3ZZE5_9ACTN|nr:DUF2202 domain-containing protein [Virgisporangium ochraceum]GIJ71692.1 hypothetical protein Voc01_066090 [Virgisporangium ochraceum]